jgi:hypothetical protein
MALAALCQARWCWGISGKDAQKKFSSNGVNFRFAVLLLNVWWMF